MHLFSAMETNDLGFVASLLFVLVPTVFLIILYIQTNSRQG
jgi:photosystem II PsbM protein